MSNSVINLGQISERFCKIKVHFCENNLQNFAQKTGINYHSLSAICNGRRKVGDDVMSKILETFPEVSRSWLILGEGEMLNTQEPAQHVTQTTNGAANAINSNGSHNTNTNTINTNDNSALINEVIKGKDEQIQTLKETISALTGEVEQLRNYVSLTSSKYINVIERMLYTTNETNDLIKAGYNKIGFKCKEQEQD